MKNSFKIRYIILGMIITVILNSVIIPVFAAKITKQLTANYNDIKIAVDGTLITPKDAGGKVVEPFIIDGTTYLPIRAVSEGFGAKVDWDENMKTVVIESK